jgi:hypothetical protein
MADDDHDEEPLYLGVGACHELANTKPRRKPKQSRPIGFLHSYLPKIPTEKSPPTKKVRRAPKAR